MVGVRILLIVIAVFSSSTVVVSFAPGPSTGNDRTRRMASSGAHASSTTTTSSPGGEERAVDRTMHATYESLATRLIERYERGISCQGDDDECRLRNGQLFVGIAGGPGSGKSTLSNAVARIINERMAVRRMTNASTTTKTTTTTTTTGSDDDASETRVDAAVVLPMDGFHYARSRLMDMGSSSTTAAAAAGRTYDELLARRGAPWTFDAEACIDAFTNARMTGSARLPTYSRERSDPIPDGVILHRETKIVLLEGNYLLAWDDPRWSPLRTNMVFDETWYVHCKSRNAVRERLVRRHLETWTDEKTRMFGEGAMGAGVKADMNDMMNLDWIEEMSRKHADCVIESL